MKRTSKITALLALSTLLGGWALPSKDVNAKNIVAEESVSLGLTGSEVTVAQNSEFDARQLVVTGSFDTLEHSIVDTSNPGLVNVTFVAKKGLETIKMSKVISIKDGVAPVIEGSDTIELRYDSEYDILTAYEVTDNMDEEVNVEIVGEVDRLTAGEYTIQVVATDSSENTTTKEVVVTVNEDPVVVARKARNAEYAPLVEQASSLNVKLLANTTVDAIQSMLTKVNNAKSQDSDYKDQLAQLSVSLSAKLERARVFHAPAPTPAPAAPAPARSNTPSTPAPAPAPAPASSLGQSAANIALRYNGGRYVWGGTSPNGFDCSGLTYYVYAQLGYSIPRSSYGQMYAGYAVSSPAVGDLVIYNGGGHVALYIGNGQVIHALNPRQGIQITGLHAMGSPNAFRRVLP